MLDLGQIPILDQHAHPLLKPETPFPYLSAFTESYDPDVIRWHAPETLFARRSIREIATVLACAPEWSAVEGARQRLGFDEVARRFFTASGIDTLLLDDGLLPERTLPVAWHRRYARAYRLLRVEYLAEGLIGEATSWAEFRERFRTAVRSPVSDVVGLKSIVAYRTGLAVLASDAAAAAADFQALRQRVSEGESVRLARKALNDWVVHATLEEAARNGRPVQFHTGFGDPDLDLRLANPLQLRPILEDPTVRRVPIVLLHAGYPFTREAGYLAAVYPNVFLDLGLAIPMLSVAGMGGVIRAALELTPLSKILFSTDAHLIPELFYLGATWGRQALGAELNQAIADGDLTAAEAEKGAARILRENAAELYGLA